MSILAIDISLEESTYVQFVELSECLEHVSCPIDTNNECREGWAWLRAFVEEFLQAQWRSERAIEFPILESNDRKNEEKDCSHWDSSSSYRMELRSDVPVLLDPMAYSLFENTDQDSAAKSQQHHSDLIVVNLNWTKLMVSLQFESSVIYLRLLLQDLLKFRLGDDFPSCKMVSVQRIIIISPLPIGYH